MNLQDRAQLLFDTALANEQYERLDKHERYPFNHNGHTPWVNLVGMRLGRGVCFARDTGDVVVRHNEVTGEVWILGEAEDLGIVKVKQPVGTFGLVRGNGTLTGLEVVRHQKGK